ncbi:hypothetical protein RFI_23031 [Reticulomyxa filosa]|uniref:Uncharacterized protein n=1 Tax=Reticulomyxa filosa TaxID=46433 RepID=X6MMM5_RETFI|nr:hypothetical protein RFI_23031 [Reticulomyxa filosa]|eukprot:ETO14335.1 hypothetical protein RFI_23031 [Reticulomyxa filosa]
MSSYKVYVNDGIKVHTIILKELTVKHLRQQIAEATQSTHVNSELIKIIGEDGCFIETNEDILRVFTSDRRYFTLELKKKAIPSPVRAIKNPLILMVGAMKYEQLPYLKDAQEDLWLLQALFQSKFGYRVFSTYNQFNQCTELLSLNRLENFLLNHYTSLFDHDNNYDGLIFVWCGYGGVASNQDALITSDMNTKDFKSIQYDFVKRTDYFIGKPKIFINVTYKGKHNQIKMNPENEIIQKDNYDEDILTIFVNITPKCIVDDLKDKNERKGSNFVKIFRQKIKDNINSWNSIIEQVTQIILNKESISETIQTISTFRSDAYLVPISRYQKYYNSIDPDENVNSDDNNDEQPVIKKDNIPEEAAKIVKEMLDKNEQGLIVIIYNSPGWKNKRDNISLFMTLISNEKNDKKEFGEYCMFVIKKKLIILEEEINIDGNIYAVDCKLICKRNANITTQLFVTKNAIIDQQLKQLTSPIQWNTKIHYDIPLLLQDIEDKGDQCKEKKFFDASINYLQQYLQIATNTFGSDHPYVATSNAYDKKEKFNKAIEYYKKSLKIRLYIFGGIHADVAHSYNNLGLSYVNIMHGEKAQECHEKAFKIRLAIFGANHDLYITIKKNYDKAIEFCEKSLKIRSNCFGINRTHIASLYTILGLSYHNKGQYNEAIECYKKELPIRKEVFGKTNKSIGDSNWNLACAFEQQKEKKTALKYFEEAYKIYSAALGEVHAETLKVKHKIKELMNDV